MTAAAAATLSWGSRAASSSACSSANPSVGKLDMILAGGVGRAVEDAAVGQIDLDRPAGDRRAILVSARPGRPATVSPR